MSDDAPTQPKKLTVEDLVLAQRKTQKALEDVVERLDMMVDREVYVEEDPSGNVVLFRVFSIFFMVGCWFASSVYGPTPVLIFISFVLYAWVGVFFDISGRSAREQDKKRRVRAYWKQRDAEIRAEQWKRTNAQFSKYQERIKSAIASSRWFPTNWR